MTEKAPLRPLELVEIESSRAGQRLDNYLFNRLKGIPKGAIYRVLRKGQVRVNKGRVKPHYKLKAGDQLRIPPLRIESSEQQQERAVSGPQAVAMTRQLFANILFEDEQLVILNKPAGLAVHGGSGMHYGLIELLKAGGGRYSALELVHRLDKGTSGCLLLAKNHQALRRLHELLRQHHVEKTYVTLLQGALSQPVSVDTDLQRARRGGESVVDVVESGKAAYTHITPLQQYSGMTLAEVRIETGRTHQIRVHCSSLGHPLAGDEKYGERDFNRALRKQGLKRMFLHASTIRFTLDETYNITAPLPDELAVFLEQLEKL